VRALVALLVVCGSLVLVAPAVAADHVERGIVQSLGPTSAVLRALDGSDVTVALGPATRYRLNGRLVTRRALRPGLVAEAVSDEAGVTRVLRAFGRVTDRREAGVLVGVRPRALVLRRESGDTVRIALTSRTVVWLGDRRVSRRALRPGRSLDVVLARNGSARLVIVLRSGVR